MEHIILHMRIYIRVKCMYNSDDYMPDDAVEKIKEAWKKVRDNKKISGLIGLDAI